MQALKVAIAPIKVGFALLHRGGYKRYQFKSYREKIVTTWVFHLITIVDRWRCLVLRKTLCFAPLRKIYLNRVHRLTFLHFISIFVNLILACMFPGLILILGPILLGLPHLLADYIYLPGIHRIDSERMFLGAFLVFGAISRVFLDYLFPFAFSFPWVEFLSLAGILLLVCYQKAQYAMRALLMSVEISVCAALIYFWPIQVFSVLILFHNAQAYLFWLRSAGDRCQHVFLAGTMFLLVTMLILSGAFDTLLLATLKHSFLQISNFSVEVVPYKLEGIQFLRVMVVAAFGQSMHYFVWLKAIPDQVRLEPIPLPFRRSLRRAYQTIGPLPIFLCLLTGAIILSVALYSLNSARMLYFAIASVHGFIELGLLLHLFNERLLGSSNG